MKPIVIFPTYNERENISFILPEVLKINSQIHILVVDDSSPDKTYEVVEQFAKEESRIHLLLRKEKKGLGRAYIAGFQWALQEGFDFIIEMDADFSHRPVDLNPILEAAEKNDFVVGSRYTEGGGTKNWGLGRRLLSRGGSLYSRWILGFPLHDWTGGFNGWHARVLQGIGLEYVKSEGYSFQIELKYKALLKGFKGKEVPILFEERRVGQSKMSSRIVLEALFRVWKLKYSKNKC